MRRCTASHHWNQIGFGCNIHHRTCARRNQNTTGEKDERSRWRVSGVAATVSWVRFQSVSVRNRSDGSFRETRFILQRQERTGRLWELEAEREPEACDREHSWKEAELDQRASGNWQNIDGHSFAPLPDVCSSPSLIRVAGNSRPDHVRSVTC